jgi:uncharacterized protein YegL
MNQSDRNPAISTEEIQAWSLSPEGKKALIGALVLAADIIEKMKKDREIDPTKFYEPFTL